MTELEICEKSDQLETVRTTTVRSTTSTTLHNL